MVVLFVLLIILVLLAVLLFAIASKVIFHFDSVTSEMNVTLLWLDPFLRSSVSSDNGKLMLSIYLLNKRILRRQMKPNKTTAKNRDFLKKFHPTRVNIQAEYGFRDPYFTGLACSTISMISQFFPIESLYQKPDFLAFDDYVHVDGTAQLNLGRALLSLV